MHLIERLIINPILYRSPKVPAKRTTKHLSQKHAVNVRSANVSHNIKMALDRKTSSYRQRGNAFMERMIRNENPTARRTRTRVDSVQLRLGEISKRERRFPIAVMPVS